MKFKLCFLLLSMCLISCTTGTLPLYVGTYTHGDSKGIYLFQFNTETGELSKKQLAAETVNPSFIAYSPNKKYIYAVGENKNGSVSSFAVKETGALLFLNKVDSNGAAPCHISINNAGDKAVVSNYVGGNIALFNISNKGTITDAYQIFDYNTPYKVSHAHSAQFYKDQLFVSDLGLNALYQYQLNSDQKKYDLTSPSILDIPEKAGPRHFSLSKDGQFMYIINEYASTVTAVKKVDNQFENIGNYSTLDENYKGANSCADIHLSKDEGFLYGSNRGENSIIVFKRNQLDGTLKKIQNITAEGDWPRNFTADPTGNYLLVANQKSNHISVFKINSRTGKLNFLNSVGVPSPACLLF